MNLENIQSLAHEACFSTIIEIKNEAQKIFMNFTYNLPLQNYVAILQNFSQTVLFVFLSYLNKKIKQINQSNQIAEIFSILKTSIQSWYQNNGSVQRPKQSQKLKNYVVNTYGMVLGTCMKYLFLNQNFKQNLIYYLKTQENSHFKLFLNRSFVDVVSTVDDQIDYARYRQLVYSFQDLIIPIFIEDIYPYFILITDNIKIEQLMNMLPSLNQKQQNLLHYQMFQTHDKTLCLLVFNLLNQIINFKYNITIGEFDFEAEFQNCTISFPQPIMTKITSKQFLQAFYYMLQKMAFLSYNGPYSSISFQCLKKILLSKTSHLKQKQVFRIISTHFKGINSLCQMEINSPKILNQVFECSFKFIHSFELSQMDKAHINYLQWINNIKLKALKVISSIELTNQNPLYRSTCELISKIARQSIDMSQQKYLPIYEQLCRDFFRQFFDSFIEKNQLFYGNTSFQKIAPLQAIIRQFFDDITKIGSMDMDFMFDILASRMNQIFSSKNLIKISNFLFLITQIMDQNFYDRSLIFQETSQQVLKKLGMIIRRCLEFMEYRKQWNQSAGIMDIAILLFKEKLLNECMSDLSDSEQQILISSNTYRVINSYQKIQVSDQIFLTKYLRELVQILHSRRYGQIEYSLQLLYSLFLKLKWSIKRDVFLRSPSLQQIKNQIIKVSILDHLQKQPFLKQRRKLFKIISVLNFNDLLDPYKKYIGYVTQSIEHNYRKKQFEKITFDVSGICQNIDTPLIYRYFLLQIDQIIGLQNLFRQLYNNFQNNLQMLEQVVYLNHSILQNKAQRMTSPQLSMIIYSIIDATLPFITNILAKCHDQQYTQLLQQVFTMANIILDAKYINIFLVLRKSQQKFINFLRYLMENILLNYEWVQNYPELKKNVHETIRILLSNCLELIFRQQSSDTTNDLLNNYAKSINFSIQVCQKLLKGISQGRKQTQLCDQLLQTISHTFKEIYKRHLYTHLPILVENLNRILQQNKIVYLSFMRELFKYGISNAKSSMNTLLNICCAIQTFSHFYLNEYNQIILSLGVNGKKLQRIHKIYKPLVNQNDFSVFVVNLKQWFKTQEKAEQTVIDY